MVQQFAIMPDKDPGSVEPYFVVWCSSDGTNDGSEDDNGMLQGETIASVVWAITPNTITKDSDNTAAVTIHGVHYAVNTVCTIWLSGGEDEVNYELTCKIVTSGSTPRRLEKTISILVQQQ